MTDEVVENSGRAGVFTPLTKADFVERPVQALAKFVDERPLAVVVGASAVGVALGGLLLSRLGRLAFAAAVGYVASDLWRREGGLDIDDVLRQLLG